MGATYKKKIAAAKKQHLAEELVEDLVPDQLIPTTPKAKLYKEELNRLHLKYGGRLTAQDIVNEAKKKDSPLHDYFDWDVKQAAQKYWLSQARSLVRVVKVTYLNDPSPQQPKRAVVTVVRDDGSRSYSGILSALSTERSRMALIAREIRTIKGCKDRLKAYSEMIQLIPLLNEAVEQGEELLASMEKKAKKKSAECARRPAIPVSLSPAFHPS